MSDFLTNLSVRSFGFAGDVEVIKPRRQSLFEQAQVAETPSDAIGSALPLTENTRISTAQVEKIQATTLTDVGEPSLNAGQKASPAKHWPPSHDLLGIRAERPEPKPAAGNISAQPTGMDGQPEWQVPKPSQIGIKTGLSQEAGLSMAAKPNPKPNQEPQAEQQQSHVANDFGLSVDKALLASLVAETVSLQTLANAHKPEQPANPANPATAIVPRVDAAMVMAAWPGSHAGSQSTNQSSSVGRPAEPVVQVSIGRIEIRAMPATNPSRNQPDKKSNTMSLDDYLGQRNRSRP